MFSTWDKPAGIPCLTPHADPEGDCVLHRLLAAQPERRAIDWPDGFAGGIAHRLDRSTSGALVVADDLQGLMQVREWFSSKALVKTYRFLAASEVRWHENRCGLEIAHAARRKRRMVVRRGKATPHRGRWYAAQTSFRRIEGRLWEAQIQTGVMHQIRVHAAFLGLALLGDRLYGGGDPREGSGPGRSFFLHHVGLVGPRGVRTDAIPLPDWAISQPDRPTPGHGR